MIQSFSLGKPWISQIGTEHQRAWLLAVGMMGSRALLQSMLHRWLRGPRLSAMMALTTVCGHFQWSIARQQSTYAIELKTMRHIQSLRDWRRTGIRWRLLSHSAFCLGRL